MKVTIKERSSDRAVISVQKRWSTWVYAPAEDIVLEQSEIDWLSFGDVMSSIFSWEEIIYDSPAPILPFSLPMNKKTIVIILTALIIITSLGISLALRNTVASLNKDIKNIRTARETEYDSCLKSCMDDRTPFDERVVEKQKKIQLLSK